MPDNDVTLKVWLGRLDEAQDARSRAECIRALEVLGHSGALPALAEIFATDAEPELRLLAQQAGKSIYYSAARQMWMRNETPDDARQTAAEALARAAAKKSSGKSS
ncbi:hypothetical protein [Aggregatilinea lenta]|uniref:hypothetical protein n=1 Tax=Aggregatilinea lenta TaxID=913108 RepID=UPI000E5B9D26|nr:hypothetical protein [Aggregatilinea lenta]